MSKTKPCICRGMNEECLFCGGSGYLTDDKIEIIKTVVDKSKLKKENDELNSYLHSNQEIYKKSKGLKMGKKRRKSSKNAGESNQLRKRSKPKRNKRSKKNTFTIKELKKTEPLKYIGPNNPNRQTNTHSKKRKQGKNSKKK